MTVKTADRTLEVFNLFAKIQRPLIYSEIAKLMGLPLSSCHALLKTMVAKGYLYEPGIREGYYPTQRLLHVSQLICAEDPLVRVLEPILLWLRDITGESALLAKLTGKQLVYLMVKESPQTIRYSQEPGRFNPLHSTGTGKGLLAVLPEANRVNLLKSYGNWDKVTDTTLLDMSALEQDIQRGIERGWQRAVGERVEDVMAVAKGFLISDEPFAFSVAGPLGRVQKHEIEIAKQLNIALAQLPPSLFQTNTKTNQTAETLR